MIDREQTIREAAYYKWDAAGRPEGRELDFWADAEREQSASAGTTTPAAVPESIPLEASLPVPVSAPVVAAVKAIEPTARTPQSAGSRKQKSS